MKIFVLNQGSSSIKSYLFDFKQEGDRSIPLWEAHLEWKGHDGTLKIKSVKGEESTSIKESSIERALAALLKEFSDGKLAVVHSKDEVDMVGHRVVHGGKYYQEPVLIDPDVKNKIRELAELAPLHNLPELKGIEILEKYFSDKPQMAVFDTAFHHTLSASSSYYPGPYEWIEEDIRKYGFHGISYQYCAWTASKMLGQESFPQKMVICHLGSGASLCAVKEGNSLDTTMGFTPLDGLMMDTRSGSVDPGLLLYLLQSKKITPEQLSDVLYKQSGLLGISGISSDMRDVLKAILEGNKRAKLALNVYIHRLNSLLGSMIASLQGLDVLVFTAGIGENAALIRHEVCKNFEFLGLKLDVAKNNDVSTQDRDLSEPSSKIKVLLIHTKEAYEIARQIHENAEHVIS